MHTHHPESLLDLVSACTPEAWRALTHSHSPGEIEALAQDPTWHNQALGALSWSYFFPRAEHLAADLAAARAALAALPEDETAESAPPTGAPAALVLPFPLTAPAGLAALGVPRGRSPDVIAALLAQDIYIEADDTPRLFPSYREQDEEQRPLALAASERLGVALPDRFLDEPYECRWYLDRSGDAALHLSADDRAALVTDRVPMWPDGATGATASPVADVAVEAICYRRLREYCRRLRDEQRYQGGDADWLSRARKGLSHLLDDYARAVMSGGDRAILLVDEELLRPLEAPAWDPDYTSRELEELRFVDERSLLLVLASWLVHVDLEGAVLGVYPNQTTLNHVTPGGLALTQCPYGHWHVLDLNAGEWRTGVTLAALFEAGELGACPTPSLAWPHGESNDPDEWDRSKYVYYTPDHRYYAAAFRHRAPGLFRTADHRLEDDETFGQLYHHDLPPSADAPLLLRDQPDGTPPTVIRGVRFTQRAPQDTNWVQEKANTAVARCGERWRFYTQGRVYEEGRALLRFGVPVFAGAFDRVGERLVIAGRRALHIASLGTAPALLKTLPLGPIREQVPSND